MSSNTEHTYLAAHAMKHHESRGNPMTIREQVEQEVASELGYTVEARGKIVTLVDLRRGGCRPASWAESNFWDALISARVRVRKLEEALERIRDGSELCECDHSTEDCCVNVDDVDCCAFCVSDVALMAPEKKGE